MMKLHKWSNLKNNADEWCRSEGWFYTSKLDDIMVLIGFAWIAFIVITVLNGCSCLRSDKALDIECKQCVVKYNHSKDYLEIKDK
jgi:hypothetical protein